jgi:hypothetical protein
MGYLAGDVSRTVGEAVRRMACEIGAVMRREVRNLVCSVARRVASMAREIGRIMPPVFERFAGSPHRRLARIPRKPAGMFACEIAGFLRAALHSAREAPLVTFVETL